MSCWHTYIHTYMKKYTYDLTVLSLYLQCLGLSCWHTYIHTCIYTYMHTFTYALTVLSLYLQRLGLSCWIYAIIAHHTPTAQLSFKCFSGLACMYICMNVCMYVRMLSSRITPSA